MNDLAAASLTFLLVLGNVPGTAPAQQWTWVHGELAGEREQAEYLQLLKRIHDYYQKRSAMKGALVAERELKARPDANVVFIGPLSAFRHREWFGLPIEVRGEREVEIAGRTLREPRTGIYLRSRDQSTVLYTGLSFAGFSDIFSVSTGPHDCTVTRSRGTASHQGDYTDAGLVIEALGFLPVYPARADVEKLRVPEGVIEVAKVVAGQGIEDLAPEFGTWLLDLVADQRVLFVGESHWNTDVNRLFHKMVEALLERGGLRSVFLEINFSFSGFYDHYAREADDARAQRFLRDSLHPLVASPSTLELLELLRRHNAAHQDRQVRVACLDMEWGHEVVLDRIVRPWLMRVDAGFVLPDPYNVKRSGGEQPRERVQELLAKAREQGVVGEHPFLTAEYVGRVIENLWDTASIADFNVDRQRFLVRNLGEFHGALLGEGLAVFKGGGFHAVKQRPEGETFYREAAWLDQVHPATRGKVRTLWLAGLGYGFAGVADLDFREHMTSATNYSNMVRDFQAAVRSGTASPDGFYLIDGELRGFEQLVARIGYDLATDVLRIGAVDWDRLAETHGRDAAQTRVRDYDATVLVLRGQLEPTRPRVLR